MMSQKSKSRGSQGKAAHKKSLEDRLLGSDFQIANVIIWALLSKPNI